MSPLWRQDPSKLARPRAGQPRKITRGPLIDLEALQEAADGQHAFVPMTITTPRE